MAKPVLIMQTGHFPSEMLPYFGGDFSRGFCQALGVENHQIQIINVYKNEPLLHHSCYCTTVITGSQSMITDHEDWSERTAVWIRNAMQDAHPIFGICYGHQLIAYALGGVIDYNPNGREIGTCNINIIDHQVAKDPLFEKFPTSFPAQQAHLQTIVKTPEDALVLAYSDRDPHQIIRYGKHAISTQFHPEFTANIMTGFIKHKEKQLQEEGLDVSALLSAIHESPQASALLQRFIAQYII